MCRSAAQGGQRCATHAGRFFKHCEQTLDLADRYEPGTANQVEAEHSFVAAARQYASMPKGEAQIRAKIEALSDFLVEDVRRRAMLEIGLRRGLDLRRANQEAYELMKRGESAFVEPSPYVPRY